LGIYISDYDLAKNMVDIYERDSDVEVFLEGIEIDHAMERLFGLANQRMTEGLHPFKEESLKTTKKRTIMDGLRSIKNSLSPPLNFIKKHAFAISIIGLVAGASLYWIVGFFKSFLSDPEEDAVSQSVDFGRAKYRVGKKVPTRLSKNLHKITVRPQAPKLDLKGDFPSIPKIESFELGVNGTNNDVLTSILNKHLFIMYILIQPKGQETEYLRLGHAQNVRGRIFMFPLHFLYQIHDVHSKPDYSGAMVVLTNSTNSIQYTCTLEEVMFNFKTTSNGADIDMCLADIPSAHPNSIGCLKYYLKQQEIECLMKNNCVRVKVVGSHKKKGSSSTILRIDRTVAAFENELIVRSNWEINEENPSYMLELAMVYEGTFGSGDCGSLLTVESTQFENRILLGMHVAGNDTLGHSTVISKEMIEEMLDSQFPRSVIFEEEESYVPVYEHEIIAQGLMKPIGKVYGEYVCANKDDSEYVKSKLFGRLPGKHNIVTHFPARLKPFKLDGLLIDPIDNARKNYCLQPVCVNAGQVKKAVASYEALIITHMYKPMAYKKALTVEEALHSFENLRGIAPSTSSGYKMKLKSVDDLKEGYFKAKYNGDEEKTQHFLERIAKEVQEKKEMYRNKIRPQYLYKDCLKDELRSKEKVKAGKTRMFSASDFIMLVMFRQYFGSFMSAFFEANIDVGSAIGINPYSGDWDNMTRKLRKFTTKRHEYAFGAGDHAKFDSRQIPIILWEILEMINRWYGPNNEDNFIREALFVEITNSKHIYRDEIFEWLMSIPSGNPLTAILNTIYNNIAFRLAFIEAGCDVKDFNENVVLMVLGDDNVFSVANFYRDKFNELAMPKLMGAIGLEYTTELKESALIPFRRIDDIEFLKRSFRYDILLNRWVAPLREESIFNTLNWTKIEKKGRQPDQITVDEIASALSELSLHGKAIFDDYAPKLLELQCVHLKGFSSKKELSLDYDVVYSETLKTDYLY